MTFAPPNWPHGVTVSTLDSESSDRGSNPREALNSPMTKVTKQKQAKASNSKQKQAKAKASKSKQKQAKASKSIQKQAKASKSKQKQKKKSKSKRNNAKAI